MTSDKAFKEWYDTRKVLRSVIQPGEEWNAALASYKDGVK